MPYLLQHLLMEGAQRHPDHPAAILGSDTLSYRELDEHSNRMAQALSANGVERGDRVGIYMSKSLESIVSIHGALKAGAVYVPLDARAPLQRLAFILRDCGIRCLIASSRKVGALGKIFAEEHPLEALILADASAGVPAEAEQEGGPRIVPWHQVVACDGTRPPENPSIETDLAYLLYTSGSTGVPKGVMISHLNSLTFVRWAGETLGVRQEDRVSCHAPIHFDLSIFDIFTSLMAGATLFPVPEVISAFPIRLADWIAGNEISVWYSVPSALSMLVGQGKLERHEFAKLRMIIFAGEVFPVKYLRAWMEKAPHAEFYNLYGPTETNVITYYRVDDLPPSQTKPVPIGKACANTEVFALTEDGSILSSPGEEGELYARGSCVAQGYWGDSEKTDRVFLPNTIQPHCGDRVYRTGDIVSLDEDGNFTYVGRRDHMIKSRGYRIELGEIEAVLYSNPAVKEAAVVPVPDELIGNRIKAFVVPETEGGATNAELDGFCAESLPKYMVPETIEFRRSLPKTSTGKVDKRALLTGET